MPEAARFRGELLGPMQGLADMSGEAVSLAVLHDRDAVIVQRFETRHVLRAEIGLGTRMPLTTCASGKVLLAAMAESEVDALFPSEELPMTTSASIRSRSEFKDRVLPAVRQHGYATTDGEYAEGITGLGAGVFDGAGRVVAALSVAGPGSRFDAECWVQPLIEAARSMSGLLTARSG